MGADNSSKEILNISGNRRDFIKYAGVTGSGLFLAGCTGNQSPKTSSSAGGNQGTKGGSNKNGGGGGNPSETPFSYVTTITPSTIDPHKASDEFETIFTHNVYDPLLYYTNDTPPKLIPWLAKEWKVSDDKKTYTFTLRGDATFQNGDDVTADDVVYSIKRLMTMNQGFSYMLDGILEPDAAKAGDKQTVRVKLSSAFGPFLSTLPFLFIVNKKQVEKHAKSSGKFGDHGDYGTKWLESNVAASGAYTMESRNRKSSIKLSKNNDWWGNFADGNTYETAYLKMVPETSTVAGMMRKGSGDLSDTYLPLQTYQQLSGENNVRVSSKVTFTPMYVFMNNARPPFDDIEVRKAMAYAFDYKKLLNGIMSGESKQMQGPLPRDMWSHNNDLKVYNKDLEKAKAHLDKSNYSGSDLNFTYTFVTGLSIRQNMGLMLQSDLNKIGVNMSVKNLPWSKIVADSANKKSSPQMVATALSFNYSDPDNFLYPAWHSSSHGTWQSGSWYTNKKVDKLLDQARKLVSKDKRTPLYKKAQKLINQDVPALFSMNQAQRYAVNANLNGFHDNGVVGYIETPSWFSQKS